MAPDYDLVIIGGGLAGSVLGKTMARQGFRVLVLEREAAFRDRVRGEYVHPWGVSEAKALGIYDLLSQTCGHEARFKLSQIAGAPSAPARDMIATSPHQTGSLHFYHPEMQEVLLQAAQQSGARVLRGRRAVGIIPGQPACVRVQSDTGAETISARLVIGADGRDSTCRKWAGFAV